MTNGQKRYYEKNKARVIAASKSRALKNPERKKEIANRWAHKAYQQNPQKFIEKSKKWRLENPERSKAVAKKYRNSNPQKGAARTKKWRENNRERYRARQNKWRSWKHFNDPTFRLRNNLRSRLRLALKGGVKSCSTVKLIGCPVELLRFHLETQFVAGMSWGNYGKMWHVDHIRPCASFDLSDPEQQKQCFHYSNLQPLFVEDNLKKGAKF